MDGLESVFPVNDEIIVMIASTKLNMPHPSYDAREYNYEHPPLGKYILGWALNRDKEYDNTLLIPINLYVYSYLASTELREEQYALRMWTAVFGLLFLVALFFLAKELFNKQVGYVSVVFAGLSVGFINISHLVFQDALLPLFITMALLFALRYVKTNPSTKWKGIPLEFIYLGTCILFMGASLLTRMGQPPFFFAGLLIGFLAVRKGWIPIAIGTILMVAVFHRIYPLTIIGELAQDTYSGALIPQIHLALFRGALDMGSYTLAGGLVLAAIGWILTRPKFSISILRKKWESLENPHRVAFIVILVTLLAGLFTPLGTAPRYYMVFLILPFVYAAYALVKYTPKWGKIILIVLLIADGMLLAGASPDYKEYSLFPGSQPFMIEQGDEYKQFEKLLDTQGITEYFTNDARIILMDERAKPIPPFHKAYYLEAKCNGKFLTEQEGKLFIYNAEYAPIQGNKFLCPLLTLETLQKVEGMEDPFGFEWYRIERTS